MGKTLWIDAFAGISGDMTIAALADAGAPEDEVLAGLASLGLPGWSGRFERVRRGPFAALRFVVEVADHGQEHDHHHAHDHAHDHASERSWRHIRALLETSPLPPRVRERAVATFAVLAAAEGRVHGVAPDDVTFHEVGAIDSIVDIVGACIALDLLQVERIVTAPLPLGAGGTRSEHGWIPLPAPATLELLRGFPVSGSPWPGETVTPTGAALLAALSRPGPLPPIRVERIGYGAGTRNPATHPNVLRVLLGEGDAGAATSICELRADVDTLSGEALPGLLDALLDAGAIDVSAVPTLMKKGRPGFRVVALCAPGDRAVVGDALLRHGRTLGYRWSHAEREILARRHVTVATPYGEVRLKLGELSGEIVHVAPEYEDVAARARTAGVPIAEVQAASMAAWSANTAPRVGR